jgi:hypothetical protein
MPIHTEHLAALKQARDKAVIEAQHAALTYAQALPIGTAERKKATYFYGSIPPVLADS